LENIIIQKDMSIKLIDFGYAVILNSKSEKLKRYCGTPYYIPPEMINKTFYDGRSFKDN
jgi:serine/threonine protein kinase